MRSSTKPSRPRLGEITFTPGTTRHLHLDEWCEVVGILEDMEKRKNTVSFTIATQYSRFRLTIARSELRMSNLDDYKKTKTEELKIMIIRTDTGYRVLLEPA